MGDPISLAVGGALLGAKIGGASAFTAAGAALGGLAGLGAGFAARSFFGRKGTDSASRTLQTSGVPQVADDSVSKRRRRIGRSALIFTDQNDILGEPTLGRNELLAI